VSDNFNDEKEFIFINNFEVQFPFFPFPKRRRDFYTSDSNDEEVNERIGDKIFGDETDENVNMEKSDKEIVKKIVEEIVKEIIKKILRTRSNRKIKKGKISLPYYEEMEDKRKKGLEHRVKPKVVRCLTRLIYRII
jgi:hypothetical protein